MLDPQQRMLLEVTWRRSNTRAGAPIGWRLRHRRVHRHHQQRLPQLLLQSGVEQLDTYFGTGNANSVAAGRLSYVLGLRGPAVSIDTACSSSLVAVHPRVRACERASAPSPWPAASA